MIDITFFHFILFYFICFVWAAKALEESLISVHLLKLGLIRLSLIREYAMATFIHKLLFLYPLHNPSISWILTVKIFSLRIEMTILEGFLSSEKGFKIDIL